MTSMMQPDPETLRAEAEQSIREGRNPKAGIGLKADITPQWSEFTRLPDGTFLWQRQIRLPGALNIGFDYTHFRLEEGQKLYIYTPDKKHILVYGPTANPEGGAYATDILPGDWLMVELHAQEPVHEAPFLISDVAYIYDHRGSAEGNYLNKSAEATCNVDVACSEADDWRDQVNSVVQLLTKISRTGLSPAYYWCSGAIMSNTSQSFDPLILTADHCSETETGGFVSTASDVAQWRFHFKREAVTCNSGTVSPQHTLIGGTRLASRKLDDGTTAGSDFYLLRLNQAIPNQYNAFYSGWDITGRLSPSGVSIHHPFDEPKKISTYTRPLKTTYYNDFTNQSFFEVYWSRTANGYGVTEPGSSGAPLYDNNKRVIGQLTGGRSDCDNPGAPDLFGKLAVSFQRQGNGGPDTYLQPWLDPANLGATVWNGAYNSNRVSANFTAQPMPAVIRTGSSLSFTDHSSGTPTSWNWEFEGGSPAVSTEQHPGPIRYDQPGTYRVILTVSNPTSSDTISQTITVTSVFLYPNPASEKLTVLLGDYAGKLEAAQLVNTAGQTVYRSTYNKNAPYQFDIPVASYATGVYLLTLIYSDFTETQKVVIQKKR